MSESNQATGKLLSEEGQARRATFAAIVLAAAGLTIPLFGALIGAIMLIRVLTLIVMRSNQAVKDIFWLIVAAAVAIIGFMLPLACAGISESVTGGKGLGGFAGLALDFLLNVWIVRRIVIGRLGHLG
ncbi:MULTISPECIES: hypothetical protein [unclassified Burkholderia]|uniref:hypothetical protein n=1 Tax=unclassified Burkholderia TaxID=2613784 RepID=UPI002AB06EE7|nr:MULTISPECIES: hypothetical protein [unclassified Burkholderia]